MAALVLEGQNIGFDENPNTFAIIYERKRQPDFGALEYAYESLALPPQAPLGAGTGWLRSMTDVFARSDQLYQQKTVVPAGIAQNAGMIYGQPMVDSNGQWAVEMPAYVLPDKMLAINQPFAVTNLL